MAEYAWMISVFGNVITLGGAIYTAQAVILTDEQAAGITASSYGTGNPKLKQALLAQSTAAKRGLWAVGIGTALQILREFIEHLCS